MLREHCVKLSKKSPYMPKYSPDKIAAYKKRRISNSVNIDGKIVVHLRDIMSHFINICVKIFKNTINLARARIY